MNNWKNHSDNVSRLSVLLGRELGIQGNDDLNMLYISSKYHDIGKLMINKDILNKKSILTIEEKDIVKKHSLYGYEILKEKGFNQRILEAVLFHHERWDGMGYIKGLKGEEIPLFSRIISIADTYDC